MTCLRWRRLHIRLSDMCDAVIPMQPTLVRQPFHRPGWIYEDKYDGWRMLASLYARTGGERRRGMIPAPKKFLLELHGITAERRAPDYRSRPSGCTIPVASTPALWLAQPAPRPR